MASDGPMEFAECFFPQGSQKGKMSIDSHENYCLGAKLPLKTAMEKQSQDSEEEDCVLGG